MIDSNNILLITDYEEVAKNVLEKLVLLRQNDSITVCSTKDAKKALKNSLFYIVIVHETENQSASLRLIKTVKETRSNLEIILLLNDLNPEFILEAYDNGIYDYFLTDSEPYEILIKTVNCFKLLMQKEICSRNEKFLQQFGVIDAKTNLYQYKYLKEIFMDISDNLRVQNGIFAVLTLDNKAKTKISTNRLAQAVKNSVRRDDIIASARGGKFYLILPNIDLEGTNSVIRKIQNKMGESFKIRAGLSKIGIQSFETLDKITQDSLTSALQNDKMSVCLENNNIDIQNDWLEDDTAVKKKNFKLFKMTFINKINNVITPGFFRFQKECEAKLINTQVSQYANDIECVFCLKNERVRSELIVRYNGYAKFKIEINHSGLDSPENYKTEIPLKAITEKYLNTLLKRLKEEYKQAAYEKGESEC